MTVQELIDKLLDCPFKNAVVAFQSGNNECHHVEAIEYYQDALSGVFITDHAE